MAIEIQNNGGAPGTLAQTRALIIVGIEWVWFSVCSGLIMYSLIKNWDYLMTDIAEGDRDLPVMYGVSSGILVFTLACNVMLTQGIIKRRYNFVFAWYIVHILMYVFAAIVFCLLVCLIVKLGSIYVAPCAMSAVVIGYRTYCLVVIVRFMRELQEEEKKQDPCKSLNTFM